MAREREVKVTILGEDKGASKALNAVEGAAAKLSPAGDAANKVLGMLGTTLGSHLGPAGGIVQKGLSGLPDLFKKSTGEGLNFSSMLTGGIVGGAAAAGAALVAFALKGVGDFQKVAGEVRQLKNVLGSTAEEASGLRNVGVMLGIDVDTLGKGLFKMSVNLEKGKQDFAGVHVEIAKNADGTTNLVKTLDNARAAYQSIHDPAQKNLFLMDAMSKAGINLRGVMSLSNAEFERFKTSGAIITDSDLKMALEYSRAQRDLGRQTQSLSVSAGRVLIPALTEVSQRTAEAAYWTDKHKAATEAVGQSLIAGAAHITPLTGFLWDLSGGHKKAGDEAEKHAAQGAALKASLHELGIEISDDEEKTGELTEETKKAKAAAEKYKEMIDKMAASVGFASQVMGRATDDLSEDQRKLAKRFDESRTAADQLKQGLDILVGVHLSAARASIDWEAKIAATSKALAENKRTLDITTEAGRENNSAILDLIQSGLAHVDAVLRETGSMEAASAATADHVQALRNVMHQAGYTDEQIEDLLRKYNLLADAPNIDKTITMNEITNRFYNEYHSTQQVGVGYTGGDNASGVYALGLEKGPIPGTGPVPIIAHGGEYVVTPAQMARLRGSGGSDGAWYGGGGITLGPGAIVVYALDPKGAALAVRDELIGYSKRVPSLGLT